MTVVGRLVLVLLLAQQVANRLDLRLQQLDPMLHSLDDFLILDHGLIAVFISFHSVFAKLFI